MRLAVIAVWVCVLGLWAAGHAVAQVPDSAFIAPWDTARTPRADSALFPTEVPHWTLPSDTPRPAAPDTNRPARADTGITRLDARWTLRRVNVTGAPNRKLYRQVRTAYFAVRQPDQVRTQDTLVLTLMAQHGHPEARIDSLRLSGRDVWVALNAGPYYRLDSLFLPDTALVFSTRLPPVGGPFHWPSLQEELKTGLRSFEENGFPFARYEAPLVRYRRAGGDTLGISVRLAFTPGPLVVVDSIRVEGEIREKNRFVAQMARIRPGSLYNQREIDGIPRMLNNSLYYRNVRPARVEFRGGHATLVVPMERRKANRLDGLLGLLPPRDGTQKLQFTGLLDLQLVSALRWGEVIQFKYEKLLATSQTLNASYMHPYLLGTGFKALVKFSLWKQDTLFLTQTFEPGGYYQISRNLQVRFSFRSENASLLSSEPYAAVVWPPPPVMNSRTRLGSLGLEVNTLDNTLNPRRGVWLETDAAYGTKRILKTVGLDSLNLSRILTRQPRTEASLYVMAFRPLAGRFVGMLGARAYWLSLAQYFTSDQRYVGGARSLRGFNENEFLARFYTILTAEVRLRLNEETYFGLFADAGYLEGIAQETPYSQRPMGIGLSLSVRTPAGQVQLSYALGRVGDIPFQPTRGRIHIGLVNHF